MTARERTRRNSPQRQTLVWQPGDPTEGPKGAAPIHGTSRHRPFPTRLLSGAIALAMVVLLLLFALSDAFYVQSVAVTGLETLTKEEVFAFADVADLHVFWVDAAVVRENLLRSPSIADASVRLGWPPRPLVIEIDEREPVVLWEQGGVSIWLDVRGRAMAQREARDSLIRVVAEQGSVEDTIGDGGTIDPGIVQGAIQLRDLMGISTLRYDNVHGLGYKNESGWDVWFGVGVDMPDKVLIYQAIADSLRARGIQPGVVHVGNADAPYYDVLWGRS
jgi:hypothetical protein